MCKTTAVIGQSKKCLNSRPATAGDTVYSFSAGVLFREYFQLLKFVNIEFKMCTVPLKTEKLINWIFFDIVSNECNRKRSIIHFVWNYIVATTVQIFVYHFRNGDADNIHFSRGQVECKRVSDWRLTACSLDVLHVPHSIYIYICHIVYLTSWFQLKQLLVEVIMLRLNACRRD